jgi:hypothetical protein
VNKMRFHCEPLALDEVLTWVMEVKLLQRVLAITHLQRVTFSEAKLDRVAIVNHLVWSLAPTDLERRLPRTDGVGNVDGRLLAALGAWRVHWIETAPFVGTSFSPVSPMVLVSDPDGCTQGA